MTLLLLALACAPASITVGGGNTVFAHSGVPETTDIPVAAITDTASHPMGNQAACASWAHTWLEFDINGDVPNDTEPMFIVAFSDGNWYQTENGWLEIGPSDPTTITAVFNMADKVVMDPHDVVSALTMEMLTANYDDLGEMIPIFANGDSITYIPPTTDDP